MTAMMLASIGGDAIRWVVYLVGMSLILAFWWVVITRLGSF
jgi:hypothetical protein